MRLADPCLHHKPAPLPLPPAIHMPPLQAEALAFQTLASKEAPNHVGDPAPFRQMHDWMRRTYPLVFERLEAERVGGQGWAGIDGSRRSARHGWR